MKGRIYIAYVSNMDVRQMTHRCPDAQLLGTGLLEGWRLMFKGSLTGAYATIEREKGCTVPILLWRISVADEERLDRAVVHAQFAELGRGDQLGVGQPASVAQLRQVDQQFVASKRRRTHVRRVARSDAAQRQDLPERLSADDEPVDEVVRGWAEVA